MKYLLTALLVCFSVAALAKHPQCAGSLDPVNCERIRDELDSESAVKKQERSEKLQKERYGESETSAPTSTADDAYRISLTIGMTKQEVQSTWGRPLRVSTMTYKNYLNKTSVNETWVYPAHRVHFEDGKLDLIY